MEYSWGIHRVYVGYTYVSRMCRVCIGYVSGMCRNILGAKKVLRNGLAVSLAMAKMSKKMKTFAKFQGLISKKCNFFTQKFVYSIYFQ